MPSSYNGVPWPTSFMSFTVYLGAFNLDVVGLFGYGICSMAVPFQDAFILHMLLLPMLSAGIALAHVVSKILKPLETKEKKAHRKAQTIKLLIVLILFMYAGLATRCFQMFKCKQFHGVDYTVLEAEPSMICHQEKHMLYATLAIVFIVVYVLGIPLTMWYVMWCNKKNLFVEEGKEPSEEQKEIEFELGGLYTQCACA